MDEHRCSTKQLYNIRIDINIQQTSNKKIHIIKKVIIKSGSRHSTQSEPIPVHEFYT